MAYVDSELTDFLTRGLASFVSDKQLRNVAAIMAKIEMIAHQDQFPLNLFELHKDKFYFCLNNMLSKNYRSYDYNMSPENVEITARVCYMNGWYRVILHL